MTLTESDKLFIQELQRTAGDNRESRKRGDRPKSLMTSKGFLSQELLELLGVDENSQGFWAVGVYVELEPMFKQQIAKDWQE